MKSFRFFSLLLGCVALASCDKNRVFDNYKSIEDKGWHKDSVVHFQLPILDSLKQYQLFFNIRNTNDFKYSNLFLITAIEFPNGKNEVDTLEYKLAEPDGTWLGQGFSTLKENKLWFKENFKFSENGAYKIKLRHAMRTNGKVNGIVYLKGISDVGFRIETSETD